MKRVNLDLFFEPKNIAIIGASENIVKVGGILLKKVIDSKIEVIPVNPSHEEIMGKKCYRSILDFKGSIDLVAIAVPADYVPGVLEECGKKGIKNVILVSAGFSETGNKKGVEANLKIAEKYGMRFLGSNCFGICNPSKNLDLTFSWSMPGDGDVAFISQSGALWSYVADYFKGKMGFSKYVSLGNMENLEFSDFIEYFIEDKKTKSIVLYIEKLKDGRRFMEACRKAIAKGKKIYAIKGGSSSMGEKAAISHTASLASDYAVYKGALKQCGVVQCESVFDAFVLASGKKVVFDKKNIDVGKKVFILTNAGGAGVLISDYLYTKGVEVIEKPVDVIGTALASDYKRYFDEVKNKKFETLLVVLTPQSMTEIEKTAEMVVSFKKELAKMNKRVVALFLGGEAVKSANKVFEKNGVEYSSTIEGI
jgi:acetyltransferase